MPRFPRARALVLAVVCAGVVGVCPRIGRAQGELQAIQTLERISRGMRGGSCMSIPTAIEALGVLGEPGDVGALQAQLFRLRNKRVAPRYETDQAGSALEQFLASQPNAAARLIGSSTIRPLPFPGLRYDTYDLVVVGAGPAGLVAALSATRDLATIGGRETPRILVIEKRSAVPVGTDLFDLGAIEGTSFARDQIVGLRPGIVNEMADRYINIPTQYRATFTRVGEDNPTIAPPANTWLESVIATPPSHVIPINVLQWELYQQALDRGIEVVFDAQIDALGTVENGTVPVVITGDDGATHAPIRTRWIIGADGARSRVRELAGIDLINGDVQGAVAGVWFQGPHHPGRLLFQAQELPGQSGRILQHGDAIFGPYALPNRLGSPALGALARGAPLTTTQQLGILHHADGIARQLVPPDERTRILADRFQLAPIRLQRVTTTVSPEHRVVLVGDAILTVNPFTTMGANAGMDAAMEASGILGLITTRDGDLEGSLRAYDAKWLRNAQRLHELSEEHRAKFADPR